MPTSSNNPKTVRISIPAESVTSERLLADLQGQFPDYEFEDLGKNRILGKKGKSVGLYIKVSKKAISLQSNFPTSGGKAAFTFFLLLLGVVIPLLAYAAIYGKKMKTLRKGVADHIKEQYSS